MILFQENPCTHPVVILRDSTYADVEGLVRYIYRGEVDVEPDRLQSFLRTAELLKIKGLADQGHAVRRPSRRCPFKVISFYSKI